MRRSDRLQCKTKKKTVNMTKMLISLHDTVSYLTTFTRNILYTVNIYEKYEEKKNSRLNNMTSLIRLDLQ